MKKLEGKVAIVTGASRGVGEYMAREFAKEGCNVVVAARTEEVKDPKLPGTIFSTADELTRMGVRAIPVRCDVTDEDSINAIRARARVGNVYVNRNQIGAVVGVQPFGGEGLSGTGPKAGGPHYLLRFASERTFTVNTAAAGGNASLIACSE